MEAGEGAQNRNGGGRENVVEKEGQRREWERI